MSNHAIEASGSVDWRHVAAMTVAWLLLLGAHSAFAAAGQNKQPWSAQPYDRAAMAVIMHQIDNGASGTSAGGSSTALVCGGGGGSSSATANSSCIIINNGAATINAGQASDGTQTANSSTSTTTNTPDPNSLSGALSGLTPGN